jgi:predicted DNA-binding transcriptional regulator AlpA
MADHHDGLEDLVTRAHIARRLHLSRAAAARAASAPGFPAPVGRLGASVVWRWSDVRAWAEAERGRPGGPTDEAMHVAGIRDRFRAAGFRLKIVPDPEGGWRAVRVAIGGHSATGQPFRGATREEAAERALAWLETHH